MVINKNKSFFICALFCFLFSKTNAQLGFCSGNSGDPIFIENFGTGVTNNSLPAGTTTYNYLNGFPNDGQYTISNGTFGNSFDWHQISDHTTGDTNGKCLVVNAAASAGEFYRTTVSGLCETTTYEFSAWVVNLVIANSFCSGQAGGTIPINVRFEIWDITDTNVIASGNTDNIVETSSPNWQEFGLVFQTLSGQNEVILKMINNGQGGCGNDLAIDDIEFKTCGDIIIVTDTNNNTSVSLCSSQTPFNSTLIATPDFSVYNTHFYQWQQSIDAGITWIDIAGKTNQTLSISVSNTTYYRTKIAEVVVNLSNPQCILFSEVYQITVNQVPIMPTLECWETVTLNNETCLWEFTGTQPVEPTNIECWETVMFNNGTCLWEVTGTKPIEPQVNCNEIAMFNDLTCIWDVTQKNVDPILETLFFCENGDIELSADIDNASYVWSTGDITRDINVDESGTFSVEITDEQACITTKIITLNAYDVPEIDSIVSEGNSIIINLASNGDYEYSLDANSYQTNPVFQNVQGGYYTIYVRNFYDCDIVTSMHLHFIIPKFMTPNGDSYHDTFNLKGIELFQTSEVYIFDRFGKLLKSTKNAPFAWDGTFNNQLLPSNDYWYVIKIEGQEYRGHLALKR